MIRKLMYKWFGLTDECASCEILRDQLHKCEVERRDLLTRLLTPPVVAEVKEETEEFKPIQPQFMPWRVRQQIMEAEDRKQAQLLKQSAKEIAELEKELAIEPDRGPSGGVSAQVK